MATTLSKMMKRLPRKRREKVEARAKELIAEEMALRDLRKALGLTQERMAELLGVGQDSVSRLETRSDLLLSTLSAYVEALGGSLQVVAKFPNRQPLVLAGLPGMAEAKGKKTRRRGRRTAAA